MTPTKLHIPSRFNVDRINHAIAVMEDVIAQERKFDLESWYGSMNQICARLTHEKRDVVTPEDVHACGTTACMFGWIATTPEFHAAGGVVGEGELLFGDVSNPRNFPSYRSAVNWFGTEDVLLIVLPDGEYITDLEPASMEALTKAYDAHPEAPDCEIDYEMLQVSGYGFGDCLNVTPQQVLALLIEIRDTGMVPVFVNDEDCI